MGQSILVINCGSSSIKFAMVDAANGSQSITGLAERLLGDDPTVSWKYTPPHGETEKASLSLDISDHNAAMQAIIEILKQRNLLNEDLIGVGHRVVHGGEAFKSATLITDEVVEAIDAQSDLAPLHNPAHVVGIKVAQSFLGDIPHVAVFDTAFHQTLPAHAYIYPIPYEYYEQYGIRKYGFHGTSHRFVTMQAAKQLNRPLEQSAFICAHLGNGCSATAVLNGKSIDTTMGLTPLEGLVMGTRCGNIDPSILTFLGQKGMSLTDLSNMMNKSSGLLGISKLSNDMRTLEQAANEGNELARLAIDIFCYRLVKTIGSLAVTMPHIDALIFTGGIGENAVSIRAQVLDQLEVLGFKLDSVQNGSHGADNNGIVTLPDSTTAMVVQTNEEWMIAQDSVNVIKVN